jgi:hypothetical protein
MSVWPTAQQETLLRAALLSSPQSRQAALAAWQEWRPNLEHGLDASTFRLLPLVYHNLKQHGLDDPLLGRLKGVYRKTWVENQLLFQQSAPILDLFAAAGIPTLVLKGAALVQRYYGDPGLRPMRDVDVLVPSAERPAAFQALQAAGWQAQVHPGLSASALPAFLDLRHAIAFRKNQQEFDLHWHLLMDHLDPGSDDEFWQAAQPFEFSGRPSLALCPTDSLLHVCVHGLHWEGDAPLRWIPDALSILRSPGAAIDWPRLPGLAQPRRLGLILATALDFLRRRFDAPIPQQAIQELQDLPVQPWMRQELAMFTHRRSRLLGNLTRYWFSYLRRSHFKPTPLGFLRHLQVYKGFETPGQSLAWSAGKAAARLQRLMLDR